MATIHLRIWSIDELVSPLFILNSWQPTDGSVFLCKSIERARAAIRRVIRTRKTQVRRIRKDIFMPWWLLEVYSDQINWMALSRGLLFGCLSFRYYYSFGFLIKKIINMICRCEQRLVIKIISNRLSEPVEYSIYSWYIF